MKHFGIDWGAFLAGLEAWEKLAPAARAVFVERFSALTEVRLAAMEPAELHSDAIVALRESGLIAPTPEGKHLRVADAFLPFQRGLRALGRLSPFDEPDDARLARYIDFHFSLDECSALTAPWRGYGTPEEAAERVGDREWLESLQQAADPVAWEAARAGVFEVRCLAEPAVAATLRALLDRLLAKGRPVLLRELCRDLLRAAPDTSRPILGDALYAGIRYLLLYPALRPADWEPIVGLWPPLLRRLSRAQAPAAVEPEAECPAAFGLADLQLLLAACATDPPRLRAGDQAIYARTRDTLAKRLAPLAPWAQAALDGSDSERLDRAQRFLRLLGFIEIETANDGPRLTATATGRHWLALPAKEQVRHLLDDLRRALDAPDDTPDKSGGTFPFLPPDRLLPLKGELDEPAAVAASFRDLPEGVFFDLAAFLSHRTESANPLFELDRSPRRPQWLPTSTEPLERLWSRRLQTFFFDRLALLGGVRLGHVDGALCFALTDAGRYLLGEAADFRWDSAEAQGQIAIEPDLTISLLSASVATEAVLSRFAERREASAEISADALPVFDLTRRALFTAVANGVAPGEILATLSRHAPRGIPDAVARQLEEWFDQCRSVTLRPALLVECPDALTAERAAAAAGKGLTRLSATVLSLADPGRRAEVVRKLREVGVFVESE